MQSRMLSLAALCAAPFIFSAAAHAQYDFSNYQSNYTYSDFGDPNYYGNAIQTPYGYQIIITPPDAILYTDPGYRDERRFERYEQRNFHPGYDSWTDYQYDPPWHHQYDLRRNFHPYWMR